MKMPLSQYKEITIQEKKNAFGAIRIAAALAKIVDRHNHWSYIFHSHYSYLVTYTNKNVHV